MGVRGDTDQLGGAYPLSPQICCLMPSFYKYILRWRHSHIFYQ